MRISRAQVQEVLRTYLRESSRTAGRTPSPGVGRDVLSLSVEARQAAEWVARARELPDVRPPEVARVREALRRGTYDVSPEQVAEKILGRLLADEALKE